MGIIKNTNMMAYNNNNRINSMNNQINFRPIIPNKIKRRSYSKNKTKLIKRRMNSNKIINKNIEKINKKKGWNDTLYHGGLFDNRIKKKEVFDEKKIYENY